MKRCLPGLTLALLSLLVASCSSGGGRRLDLAPTLVSAVFVGSSATPASGDRLRLQFSEAVELVAGRVLDDADVALSAGTLGAVPVVPNQVSTRVIDVTLGSGVSFTPGTTTIDFSTDNDVVRDVNGTFVLAAGSVVITEGDGDDPQVDNLTLNGIDGLSNGQGPAGGTLQVPPSGFTIDIVYSDATSGIDLSQIVVAANVEVSTPSGKRAAGENLLADLSGVPGANAASLTVPGGVVFPVGLQQITVLVRDTTGQISAPVSFPFRVVAVSNTIRPFETVVNPSQLWFLDTSRDIESYSVNLSQSVPVVVQSTANGTPDLLDLFAVIGLQHSAPIANVQPGKDSNVVVMDLFRARLLAELDGFFAGTKVAFTFTPQGSFPSSTGAVAYNSGSFSQICIAGSFDTTGGSGVLGLAMFDENNQLQNDNCQTAFGTGSDRLGVFLHTIVSSGIRQPPVSTFRTTFDALTPARSGIAIGAVSNDKDRLNNVLNDARATAIDLAIQRMGRFAAVVVAHECGHSMGLVKDGAMPTGLYGNDTSSFPGSSEGHIRMPTTVFPAGSNNIMSPALGFGPAQASETAFNRLNLAYLRELALYDF